MLPKYLLLLTLLCISIVHLWNINPLKPNGIAHYYQFDLSISIFSVVGWYFSFLFKLNRTEETLIRRSIWDCTICLCLTKRMLGLSGLMMIFMEV